MPESGLQFLGLIFVCFCINKCVYMEELHSHFPIIISFPKTTLSFIKRHVGGKI